MEKTQAGYSARPGYSDLQELSTGGGNVCAEDPAAASLLTQRPRGLCHATIPQPRFGVHAGLTARRLNPRARSRRRCRPQGEGEAPARIGPPIAGPRQTLPAQAYSSWATNWWSSIGVPQTEHMPVIG